MRNYITYRKKDIDNNLRIARFRPLDVMIVGGTGARKSSTLNGMFEREVSNVGRGWDPETMEVASYMLSEDLRFWDTPGLGDGKEADKRHKKKIIDSLYKDYYMDGNRYGIVDQVLVLVDGSNRDMNSIWAY